MKQTGFVNVGRWLQEHADDPPPGEEVALQTPRLLLRDFRAADRQWLDACFAERESHQNILAFQRSPGHGSFIAVAHSICARVPYAERYALHFAVLLRETPAPIGTCSLCGAGKGSREAWIGWHYSIRYKGMGYATEAGRELIRIAFEERGVQRVVADCFESNAASIRVFEKLGMRPITAPAQDKWLIARRYRETRPIVRYAIDGTGQ